MRNVCYGTIIVFVVIFGAQCSVIAFGIPISTPNIHSFPYSSGAHNPAHGKPIFLTIYPSQSTGTFNNGYLENKLFRPMVPGRVPLETAKPSTDFAARAAEHGPPVPLRPGLRKVGVPVPNYEYNMDKPYDLKDPEQRFNNGFQKNNPLQPFAQMPGPFDERKYGSNTMDKHYDLKDPDQLVNNGFPTNNPLQPFAPIPGQLADTMSAGRRSKKRKHRRHRKNGSKGKDGKDSDSRGGREEEAGSKGEDRKVSNSQGGREEEDGSKGKDDKSDREVSNSRGGREEEEGGGSKRKSRKRGRKGSKSRRGREEEEEGDYKVGDRQWRGGAAKRTDHQADGQEDEEDRGQGRKSNRRHRHRSKGASRSRDKKQPEGDSDRNQEATGERTEGRKDEK